MTTESANTFPARLASVFLVVIFGASFLHDSVSDSILASHRGLYPMVSTNPAKLMYVVLVAALAVRCLVVSCGARLPFGRVSSEGIPSNLTWLGCIGFLFGLGDPVSVPFLLGFSCTVWCVLIVWRRPNAVDFTTRSFKISLRVLAYGLLGAFAVFCIALPCITPVVASEGAQLVSLQNHYAGYMPGVVRAVWGDRAALGVLNYGPGSALVVECVVRLTALWRSCDVVVAIKVIHLLALGALGGVLWIVRRRYALPLFALLILSSPTLSFLSQVLYYPNLSGIRFLPFVVTVGALAIATSTEAAQRLVLVLLAALCVLYAPETGIVACSAIFVFLFVRDVDARGFRSAVRSAVVSGALVCALVYAVPMLWRLCTGRHREGLPSSSFVADFMSGYCGISTWPSPVATLAFFIGVHAVYRGARRAGAHVLGRWDAYQAAIGVMILGWLFYYVHRMHPYNLYFQGALVVLLCAPRFGPALLRLRSVSGRAYLLFTAALLVGLSSETVEINIRNGREFLARRSIAAREPALETTLQVITPYSSEVAQQLSALRALGPRDSYLVLTNLSVEARTLGFNVDFPWFDPFIDVLTVGGMDALVRWINEQGPKTIVIDAPTSQLAQSVPYQTKHLSEIVRRTSAYERVRSEDGWVFYQRDEQPQITDASPG